MREMRDLLPPTYARIAKIADVHVTTVREIASRENWPKLHLPRGTVMRVMTPRDLRAEEAARERAEASEAMSDPAAELPPGELGSLIVDELRAMLVAALRTGRIDKERADALWSMIRAGERVGILGPDTGKQTDQQEETRSDDELADILQRVDERIVELARGYAERLVAERPDAEAG